MKIAFACPSYGIIEPEVAHSQRMAIIHAWTQGIEVRSDIYVDGEGWDVARNQIAWAAMEKLDDSFDGVFWCDSDMVLQKETIVELVGPQVDACTGLYYARRPPYEPRIYVFSEETQAWTPILKAGDQEERWPNALFPVHGCGFGCVYTSRHILDLTRQVDLSQLEGTQQYWFRTGRFSEDLSWCYWARKAGFVIWCNPAIQPDHLGSQRHRFNREQYEKWAQENGQAIRPAGMTLQRRDDGSYEAVVVQGLNVAPATTTAPPQPKGDTADGSIREVRSAHAAALADE